MSWKQLHNDFNALKEAEDGIARERVPAAHCYAYVTYSAGVKIRARWIDSNVAERRDPSSCRGFLLAPIILIPRVRKGDRELSVILARRPHTNSNILTKSSEKVDKAANRESAVTVSHQQRNLRLLHSQDLGGLRLVQAASEDDSMNQEGQPSLDELLFWVRDAEVGKYVAGAVGWSFLFFADHLNFAFLCNRARLPPSAAI